MTATDRLQRTGRMVADASGGHSVVMANACGSCRVGCLGRRRQADVLQLPPADAAELSARTGASVSVSVSRSGLTRLSLMAFGPFIGGLLLVAIMADDGLDGWLLLGFGAIMMGLATLISRMLVRPRVQRLLSVDARVIVSG